MNISILYFFFHLTQAHPYFADLARFFSNDLPYLLPLAIVLYILLTEKNSFSRSIYISLVVVGAFLLSDFILKGIFAIPRPFLTLKYVPLLAASGFSFPSSHATLAGALAIATIFSISKHRWFDILVCVLCLGIGMSRIMLGVHYPSDVLAGFIFGGAIAYIGHLLTPNFTF